MLFREQASDGLVCMVCHSQRYGRANREIKRRLEAVRRYSSTDTPHLVALIILTTLT